MQTTFSLSSFFGAWVDKNRKNCRIAITLQRVYTIDQSSEHSRGKAENWCAGVDDVGSMQINSVHQQIDANVFLVQCQSNKQFPLVTTS